MVGNRWAKSLQHGGVEEDVVGVVLEQLGGDGPGHDVARLQLVDEALAATVADQRAVTAERLGEQRPRHLRAEQRGRVELHELDVGARRRRPAAPWPGRRRSPRAGWSWPRRPGRSRRWPAARGGRSISCSSPSASRAPHAAAAAALARRARGRTSAPSIAAAVARDLVDERPLDLGAGRGAAGVRRRAPWSGRPRGRAAAGPRGRGRRWRPWRSAR